MSIVVLPRIEEENPFGLLAQTISEEVLPYLIALYTNKDKIARLSDTELTDFVEILQRHAPELVKDGKIDWEKVNEWAKSDEKLKQDVANYLIETKRAREEFANSPLLVKLQTLPLVASLNHQELNKIFTVGKSIKRFAEIVEKSNLPTVWKVLLLDSAEKYANRPDLIEKLERILGLENTEQPTVQQTNNQDTAKNINNWKIKLEEPQLTLNLPPPPNITNTQGSRKKSKSKSGVSLPPPPVPPPPPPTFLGFATPLPPVPPPPPPPSSSTTPSLQHSQGAYQTSDKITPPSEVPFLGDVKKLFTNEDLLTAGGTVLATLLALAATRNPQASIYIPLVLASLKEAGKKAGKRVVSVAKKIPEVIKDASKTLAQSGILGGVEPPIPKQDTITRVINPPKPPSINDLLKNVDKPKKSKGRKSRKSKN